MRSQLALGLVHVHVIALGAFFPDDPPAHDNALLSVVSSPLVPTLLLPSTSPSNHFLILGRNVTSVASDMRYLTRSQGRCATVFKRTYSNALLHVLPSPLTSAHTPPATDVIIESLSDPRA